MIIYLNQISHERLYYSPNIERRREFKFLIPELVSELEKIEMVDYEILVIDDNSTDKTLDLVKKFEDKNEKIKIF